MSSYGGPRAKRPRMDERGGYSKPRFGQRGGMSRMPAYGEHQAGGMAAAESPRILHMTVDNVKYPITVDVLHTICSSSGSVQRIAINKRNGVQALVEFIDNEAAKTAKENLDGADIYSGCCTLHVEFSLKEPPLNIFKNDSDTWDYTNESLVGREAAPKKTLLADPGPSSSYGQGGYDDSYGYGEQSYDSYGAESYDSPARGGYTSRGAPRDGYGTGGGAPSRGRGGQTRGRGSFRGRGTGPPQRAHEEYYDESYGDYGYEESGQSPVLMLYGLRFEKMTCEKIFNLFCLYGNIHGVKFLKSKEGVAMVQMEDPMMASRAMQNLTNSFLYGKRMIVDVSQSHWLQEVMKPFPMKFDDSPSYINYAESRHNRFRDPKQAGRNRIQPPFKTLHFFNVPLDFTEQKICQLFENAGAKPPQKIKLFNVRENATSATGLVEWENTSDAIEAMMETQHVTIPNPDGKFPFTFKMCFSSSPIMIRDMKRE